MGIVVQKYGGSSVADVDRIRQVAARIVRTWEDGHHVVAVVSAMGGTTDRLLELARAVCADPPAREVDMLVSVGERISMALLSMAIHALGHDAVSFTGSQSGIITTASHANARVIDVRPYRIQDELARGRIVIVAGYQGTSYEREITTLGRGGSDTTAICLAAALGADYCEICSDVDGIYTADPRVVPDARRVAQMSHDEMLELARGGARVLHDAAVEYARRHGIAIHARATASPPGQGGTVVRKDLPLDRPEVTAITGRKDVVRVRWPDAAALATLQQWLQQADLPAGAAMRLVALPGRGSELWLQTEHVPDPDAFVGRLRDARPELTVDTVGTVTIVGPDLTANPRLWSHALRALAGVGIEPDALDMGRSAVAACVPTAQVDQAVRALHHALVEAWPPRAA